MCVYTVVLSSGLYETTLNQFQTSLFFFFHPFYFRILALKFIFLKNGRFVQSSAQCVANVVHPLACSWENETDGNELKKLFVSEPEPSHTHSPGVQPLQATPLHCLWLHSAKSYFFLFKPICSCTYPCHIMQPASMIATECLDLISGHLMYTHTHDNSMWAHWSALKCFSHSTVISISLGINEVSICNVVHYSKNTLKCAVALGSLTGQKPSSGKRELTVNSSHRMQGEGNFNRTHPLWTW